MKREVRDVIQQINESQNAIAAAVEKQTDMTAEVSSNISQVATETKMITTNIKSVETSVIATREGSQKMLEAATAVESLSDDLVELIGCV